ncbi:extracellular catalytic domain type 2 short-chain-length polyhydroxyalkanoate depolymerase [Coralloluteibacterium stylophorae]|uniref:Poly(3-hydroxybutyrate) depolymerase n=1 Tax=Coralloluteibacterium stylophorae TaxID=1776034 RepID=A0A8J7VV10_9GAMM|nr:PHB depolymerase family esterase [Coralloluteibacterium stylophorae]MBS7457577.1 hypothetical protein [Coralloluteibacterium stylophorae]
MPSSPIRRPVLAALAAALLGACAQAQEAAPLPALGIDPGRVAVVGLSSGAAFATQAHLAFPERFVGAGLVAGPPYGCAGGDLQQALGSCMKGEPAPDAATLAAQVRERAQAGRIGDLSGLEGDRVWILHGRRDPVVAAPVAQAAANLYRTLAADAPGLEVVVDDARELGHGLPTADTGVDCATTGTPFLNACGFDAAGAALEAIYGSAANAAPAQAGGALMPFDQAALQPEGADAYLGDTGYLYVPERCRGESCGAVVVLHGCEQNADSVGDAFVRGSGFNRWADAYGLVVLYPQTRASYTPLNPKACWDWWGYSGADYDTRQGVQLRWLTAALDRLSGAR